MERCHSCGASLSADAEWCGQCYAPLAARAPAEQSAGAGVGTRFRPPRPEPVQEVYSRTQGGSTSFGWLGRLVISVGVMVGALVMYLSVFVGMFGLIGTQYLVVYLVIASPIVVMVLRKVWAPKRIA